MNTKCYGRSPLSMPEGIREQSNIIVCSRTGLSLREPLNCLENNQISRVIA